MKQTISKKLIKLRGQLRQKEVAAAIGIKLKRYSSYEQGTREPSATILLKLKQFYKLQSIDELIN